MLDHISGRSRGFGFVTFEEDESAFSVFLEGIMHVIRGKRVEVKPATPKGSGSMRNGGARPRKSAEFLHSNMMSTMMHGMPGQSYPYGMYSYPGGGRPDVMMPNPYPNVQYPNMMPYMMVSPQGYHSSTFNSPYAPQYSGQVMSPTASMTMQTGDPSSRMDTFFAQSGNHSPWSHQPPPRGREGSKSENRRPSGSRNRDSATSLDQHVEFASLNLGE
jgi:RNA recognition motif-containing protein